MNKLSRRSAAFALFLICLAGLDASAQQPEQIDVVSLRISHNNSVDSEAKITYRNSAQSLITIYGSVGNVVPYATPNVFGRILSTVSFINAGNVETGPTVQFRFILTAVESEPIILRPTILRRKRYFTLGGATVLRGRLEVFDRNPNVYRVVAVDDDFELKGFYKAGFFQNLGAPRTAKFDSLVYELNAAP